MPVSGFSIAVVIPAYNVQDYIDEAIESVLSQTRVPDEVIIVNDGSTDNTRQVISKYESNPAVRVIDTENRGLGPARNAGLEAASSKYVYFFDSDDVMAPTFMTVIEKSVVDYQDPDMIVFSGQSFADRGQEFAFNPPNYKRKMNAKFDNGPQMYRELQRTQSLFSSACLYVTKRSVWTDSELRFKPIVHEDEEVLLPLFFSIKRCCSLTEVLFHRRVRAGSIMTGGVTRRNAEGMLQVLETLVSLKESRPQAVYDHKDLWVSRTRGMLVASFARSIQSGARLPSILMLKVFVMVFSPKLCFQITRQYALEVVRSFRSNVAAK